MKNKYGLVIQGPLRSLGRSGSTANIALSNLDSEDVVNFFCIPTVVNYFEKFNNLEKIVCVVWDDEDKKDVELLQNIVGHENIKVIKDRTKPVLTSGGVVPGNNKYRQFYSTLKGLEFLKKEGVSHIIKVRSDQSLDINKLIEDFETVQKIRKDTVMVPRVVKNKADHLADFYFVSEIELFELLLKDFLENKEIFHHVHTDLFYCWAKRFLGQPYLPYFFSKTDLFKEYVLKAWNFGFCPASKKVYSSIVWRGENLAYSATDNIFLEDIDYNLVLRQDQIIGKPTLYWLFFSRIKRNIINSYKKFFYFRRNI
ncbi:hypothetical protein DFP85_10160 [Halomonas ventosae]|uniref:WavE lipopolysaccharide synthesis protein n=1 Tax=Halomonas ventosae TaxID=229007 RepID=A0A4R6ZWQ7_9GAMM|nr:hypothetical protein [Halomonas ventosae]TDR57245.1 hypothetical protein DFP85_10160 [Halomonas ventosae]